MTKINVKSFNAQVYNLASSRLKLKRREKTILFRMMGFLIRNDKPFPYSVRSLCDITGYSRSSIFECLNTLENLRIIQRIGLTNMVRFKKGAIMSRICSLVQKRISTALNKTLTLVQKLDEPIPTSPETGYKQTSSSCKRKDKRPSVNHELLQDLKWYKDRPNLRMPDDLVASIRKYMSNGVLKLPGIHIPLSLAA